MTTLQSLMPSWIDHIWAKSPIKDGASGESLASHTFQVLSRLRELAAMRPWMPKQFQISKLWTILFWSAFFHDWGKAARGFQSMLRGQGRWAHRHEVLSLRFLDWVASLMSKDQNIAIAAAIVSHHRDWKEIRELYPDGLPVEDDPCVHLILELNEDDCAGLHRWLTEICPVWITELDFNSIGVSPLIVPPFSDLISNNAEVEAARIRKWLREFGRLNRELGGSSANLSSLACTLYRGLTIESDHVASAHAGSFPILQCDRQDVLRSVRISEADLHCHQRECASTEGSAVLVAPTGSGKTEAALLWASRQMREDNPPARLLYVLPYQASMNAMYKRLDAIFPGRVGLLHSRSLLAIYRQLMERDYGPDLALKEARYARSLAKLKFHPVRVLSPYQMLKAGFQLKGYEAMLSDFAGSAFIMDEIHCYEPERLAMILEFCRYLEKYFSCRFLFMSATLPSIIREELTSLIPIQKEIFAEPKLLNRFCRHELHVISGDLLQPAGISMIVEGVRKGQSVLVTCNTVRRAKNAYGILRSLLPEFEIVLVHSRFNGRDRIAKEQHVILQTGIGTERREPVIVISTQVVEVSLNIDLDVLFSDPAPLEALIQRFGRINRMRRVDLAPVHVFGEPHSRVYDFQLVDAAIKILAKHTGKPVDEGAIQDWLDEIYHGSKLQSWTETYSRSRTEFRQAFLNNLRPFQSDELLIEQFDRLFDGSEVLPKSFAQEFDEMRSEKMVQSAELLVPVSWLTLMKAKEKGLVSYSFGRWPPVVDIPYSTETGLGDVRDFSGLV